MKNIFRIKIIVRGEVQGVFFRHSAKEKAEELSIVGYAKNLSDGSVEIAAEGEKENLEKFIEWARAGPLSAHVTSCETEWQEAAGEFKKFSVE